MKTFLFILALILFPFAAQAQVPGVQPEFCVTSSSQTANYNQVCISASSSGGMISVNNFGTATGGLNVGIITGGTWNGNPITNPFIANAFVTINGTNCNLGASCTISAPTSGLVVGTSSITGGTTNQILYDNGGLVGEITKGNSCLYGTNGTGVPSCLTTLPANLTASSLTAPSLTATNTTITGSFTATGLVTNADLVNTVITVNTVPCTLGSSCSISAAASLVVASTTVSSGTTNQILYDNGGVLGEITKGNSCVYGTNGTGVPSCITTLPFIVSLATGGTNANLTASTGGVVYSGASALAILAGTATASLPLLSGSSAAPTWATISYPTSANSGGIPYFSSTTVISSSGALGANCVVYGGGAGATPSTSASTCPTVSNAGVVTVANATASVSTVTGAVIVTGGIGAAAASSLAGLTVTSSFTATGLVTLPSLATQSANTVLGNATSGAASPTALAVGSCSTAASALIWTTNTGFGCNTAITAAAMPASGLTGQVAVANGGTGLASGTSGGVLAYTASGTLASSAALGANCVVYGGGAGVVPATSTSTCPTVSSAGAVVVQNATAASSAVTGALIVDGGVGIAGNIFTGGAAASFGSASNTTNQLNITGPGSGANGGSYISVVNGVSNVFLLGNRSAVFSTAYDSVPIIYANDDLFVYRFSITSANYSTKTTTFATAASSGTTGTFQVQGGIAASAASWIAAPLTVSTGAAGVAATLANTAGSCTHTPTAGSETVSCSSDERLKYSIVDAAPVLNDLMKIRVRDYLVRADGSLQTGVIAQEMALVNPTYVHADANDSLMVDAPNPWKLLKAIQELKAEIEELRRASK